jgi:hypothetical protein
MQGLHDVLRNPSTTSRPFTMSPLSGPSMADRKPLICQWKSTSRRCNLNTVAYRNPVEILPSMPSPRQPLWGTPAAGGRSPRGWLAQPERHQNQATATALP